ncbi:unnamed protein product [Kluyveromyces dobzhanskii CBS 2104]|uniref:Cystathionine beta-lyase n=1 Tax=Kluyveromyces dobzhanskii CBS 2104 TaxID=1427455 RepID=A0A0A8L373_9SACH|nr:unnamed protein product [Kluyveromyces dobzhanskii CBS 2104]
MSKPSLNTSLVSVSHKDKYGSSVPPLYQSTTFKASSFSELQEYDYTRSGNPTRTVLQQQVANLYEVAPEQVFAVSSGMTALDIILRTLVDNSDHIPTIIAGDDLYGGTQRLLTFLQTRNQAKVVHTDTTDSESFITLFNSLDHVDIVLLESPTNPLLKVADLPRLCQFVKQKTGPDSNCKIVVDNTMMSGLNSNPLQYGADLVYESGTKYLNGHHDIMAGVIIAKKDVAPSVYFVINSTGAGLSPMDSWLLIRGLKTLSVRLYKQQINAMVLSHWLQDVCGFKSTQLPSDNKTINQLQTRFVGLESHPQFDLHKSFNRGPGAVLSIETGDVALSERIVTSKRLQIWAVTVSFGCVNSLISMPCKMSHASIDPELRKQRAFPEDLIRLCCGIEDIKDLQYDLLAAFEEAGLIELQQRGNDTYLLNKKNGHVARNNIGETYQENYNVYDQFFGQQIVSNTASLHRAKL